jgi:sugar/nucleoside kinase (ribokinase family)
VHFAFYPSNCGRWRAAIAGLRQRGISTSWDFGWNDGLLEDPGFVRLLRALDYVFVNEQEALLYSQEMDMAAAIRYWQTHPRNVLIKLGDKGCEWIYQTCRLRARPPRVKVVDTTGAGDAFNGGFLYAVLRGMPRQECLRIANCVGALSTRMPGGIDGLPRRDELK